MALHTISSKCPRPGSNTSPSVPGFLRTFAESPAFCPLPTSILRPLPSTSIQKHLVHEKKHHVQEKKHHAQEKKHRAEEKEHRARENNHRAGEKKTHYAEEKTPYAQENKHPMRRRINTLCAGEKTPYAQEKKHRSRTKNTLRRTINT